jgi:hypothetical protein
MCGVLLEGAAITPVDAHWDPVLAHWFLGRGSNPGPCSEPTDSPEGIRFVTEGHQPDEGPVQRGDGLPEAASPR